MKPRTKLMIAILAGLLALAALTSCDNNHLDNIIVKEGVPYSPLENYANAVEKNIQDSTRHANEVAEYLNK